jgi:hypothetical protein
MYPPFSPEDMMKEAKFYREFGRNKNWPKVMSSLPQLSTLANNGISQIALQEISIGKDDKKL